MATNNAINVNSTTPLALAIGGTSNSLTASNGGIVYSDASKLDILSGTATANQIVLSGASSAPAFSTATYLPTMTANEILYASASNTMGQITTANNATMYTNTTGVPLFTASMTDGQLLIGNSAGAPALATITPGAGISVTNGNHSITIASTSGITWIDASTTPQAVLDNKGYITDNGATQTVYNLPIAPPLGTIFKVAGFSAGGWIANVGAGDSLQIGNVAGTTSVASGNQWDCIELVYTGPSNLTWVMLSGVSNEFTIV